MAQSLFERYGGFASVSRIVMAFYDKALDSDILADYFEDVDMRRLMDHQTKFVAQLMGGPSEYTDDMLRKVHSDLNINDAAFDEMASVFKETLESAGMEADDVSMVVHEITSRRELIVTAP